MLLKTDKFELTVAHGNGSRLVRLQVRCMHCRSRWAASPGTAGSTSLAIWCSACGAAEDIVHPALEL